MRSLVRCLVVVALCGCVGPRVMQYVGTPKYAPTDPGAVVVLETVPDGAIVLGDVDGIGVTGLALGPEAIDNAKEGAASMGADAIVVVARGTEPVPGDIFGRDYLVIRVKAVRLAR